MSTQKTPRQRCGWARSDLLVDYHDHEWGVPVHDDRTLFEFLVLEGAQAGLSWETVLKKRENYRESFGNFRIDEVASYKKSKVRQLLNNPGLIRNRLKIESAIENARCVQLVQKEFGSLDAYVWQFIGGTPRQNRFENVPARTAESDAMSKDLRKRGFRFVGSTICYAFMQAVGMVNDHAPNCFRYREVRNLPTKRINILGSEPTRAG
jgi:DNA-3-methyladenine glycosylase I